MELGLSRQIDYAEISKSAPDIFTKLSDCVCGVMTGESGEYLLFAANAQEKLTPEEMQALENWLRAESGAANVEIQID